MRNHHGIFFPLPAQGHIRPMLQLSQILNSKFNFQITFINTHYNHQKLFKSLPNNNNNNNNNNNFTFESLPNSGVDEPSDNISILNSILDNKLEGPIKELLSKLCNKEWCLANDRQPVTFIVSDCAVSKMMVAVGDELGVRVVVLDTASGCGRLGYLQHRDLFDKAIIPLPDSSCLTNGYLDKTIDSVPSLEGIRLKDLPTSLRTTDPYDKMMHHVMNATSTIKSRVILINTFQSLEPRVLEDLVALSPNILPIGPLHLLVDQVLSINNAEKIRIGPEINEGLFEYLEWLDSQKPNSVVYVSVGTLVVMDIEQVIELGLGLVNSQQKFLWVVRDDLVDGGKNSLPSDIKEEIKIRGFLVSWCDQERVLSHAAIGGFLTHCGWNSMIESISNGVPMICWPFFAEQVTNSWYCCNHLGIGLRMSEIVRRGDVEKAVRELMEGENSKEMRKKAVEWRTLARDAITCPHGSSYVNLEKMVSDVLLPCISQ